VTRNTEFLINTLLTLAAYFALCWTVISVTHSGYCRCGACEDCKLRRDGSDEETTMTQATVLTATIWPRVALFNYFAVPMPFEDKAAAVRLPLDWTSSRRGGEFYDAMGE
jgi:hypothetical protein